ncbi:hypothetical protein RDWZM_006474 [Blomia tropicalis]|uniref:Glycosylphosphatidylinositol anchor attachment 1 protein n=1 Tax=Blomia tropicalis TaxID=40697 RepID=A0A9Q0M9Y3_BLOTA|nr:Glycosylphosphatidylinositol anchor attachment 1 protein [Blomia tropicalis]KAJ6220662.1 hypothetical protein RDWZM_006474 [Blomia tropicalis]
MSLLTSDDSRKTSKILRKAIHFSTFLSILSFIAGLCVLAYLVYDPDKTYFSDNGLLPGLASREYTSEVGKADEYLSELKNITSNMKDNDDLPVHYLREKFVEELGLEFYEHRFRLNYPFGQRPSFDGKNVYAILRAPRASSTEALVISTPYRTNSSIHGSNLPSVAIMLALARFFTTTHYWAKDLIFLIGDKELVGIQSWLNAYHGLTETDWLEHGRVPMTSGAIQAALNLEIHSFNPKSIDVKIEGMNGQLPNLDLFNVAIELCNRESLPATFHGTSFTSSANEWKNFISNAKTLASMMTTQATTLPTGAHGLFQRFAIQSISLEAFGVSASAKNQPTTTSVNIARSIEGIIRSLNNLQQRFYRSFWFYLLPSNRRYFSIGFYMIAFGLICLPLALRSLKVYFEAKESKESKKGKSLWTSFESAFLSHLFGIITLSIPLIMARIDTRNFTFLNQLQIHDQLFSILSAIALISLVPMIIGLRKSENDIRIQAMVSFLNAALLFGSISLINISMAFGLTALYVPLIFLTEELNPRKASPNFIYIVRSLLQRTILLMIHPLSLHLFCLIGLSIFVDSEFHSSENSFNDPMFFMLKHLRRAFESQRKTILFFIEDWFLYDNWSYPLMCLGLFPVWLQLWYNSLCKIRE